MQRNFRVARRKKGKILFFLVFIGMLFFRPVMAAPSYGLDLFAGYDSLKIDSGNPNSVRPGDPWGFGAGAGIQGKFFRGERLFMPLEGGIRYFSMSATRKSGVATVNSSLSALFAGGGLGLGVNLFPKIGLEVLFGGEYALWSVFKYHAEIPGYIPFENEGPTQGFYRMGLTLRGVYHLNPSSHLALEMFNNTGGYTWYNPGTQEEQPDKFTSLAFRLTFRYLLSNPPMVFKAKGKNSRKNLGIFEANSGGRKRTQQRVPLPDEAYVPPPRKSSTPTPSRRLPRPVAPRPVTPRTDPMAPPPGSNGDQPLEPTIVIERSSGSTPMVRPRAPASRPTVAPPKRPPLIQKSSPVLPNRTAPRQNRSTSR
jgi:hypothetical protein